MKIRVISTALLLIAAGSALAGPQSSPPDSAARMDRLAILLDLDAGQKAAVQKVFEEQHAQREALRKAAKESSTRPTREQMQAHRERAQKDTIEKLRPILSDQQMTKFEALADHRGGPRDGKRGDKPATQ